MSFEKREITQKELIKNVKKNVGARFLSVLGLKTATETKKEQKIPKKTSKKTSHN